jgi:hypothetical protein
MEKTNGSWVPGRGSTIGLLAGNAIAACSYFTDCNGASIVLHCGGEGRVWLNREFLWYTFYYPFEQLKVNKIISPVESTNLDCIKFIKHIGFRLEATLKDASPKGDLLLFTMTKEQCRWLSLKEKYRGQAESASST